MSGFDCVASHVGDLGFALFQLLRCLLSLKLSPGHELLMQTMIQANLCYAGADFCFRMRAMKAMKVTKETRATRVTRCDTV
jgi:hypothetical protein